MSAPARSETIVVAGALAQRPGIGGHAWVFVNWLLGLQAIGYDVLFLDRLEPAMLDHPGQPPEQSRQWRWLQEVMATAQMQNRFSLFFDGGWRTLGLSRSAVLERSKRSPILLDIMGYLDDDEVLASFDRLVFVDLDPGFPQFWRALGLHDAFAGHDAAVTVGLNVGGDGCTVPDPGIPCFTTVPPVDLDQWPVVLRSDDQQARATSVCTWRGPFAPIEHEGVHYGLRVHELRRFVALPGLVQNVRLEVALDIDAGDAADAALLGDNGWRLVDPRRVAADTAGYREYIQGSAAELMIAKEMYVRSRSGWFSDRSACYLASGRPVVARDTGFSAHLPTGEGLLCFTTPAEAAHALEEVTGNRARHAKAARELAVDHFDARKVLRSLLTRLGVS